MEDIRVLARRLDAEGSILVFTRGNETFAGVRMPEGMAWGLDGLAILKRTRPYLVKWRSIADLVVLEYPDLEKIIGKDVVVSDPEQIARLEAFVAEYRRRRRRMHRHVQEGHESR